MAKSSSTKRRPAPEKPIKARKCVFCSKKGQPINYKDTNLLRTVAAQTGLALENSRLSAAFAGEVAKRETLHREIEIAREVQQRLFPQTLPNIPALEYAGQTEEAFDRGRRLRRRRHDRGGNAHEVIRRHSVDDFMTIGPQGADAHFQGAVRSDQIVNALFDHHRRGVRHHLRKCWPLV